MMRTVSATSTASVQLKPSSDLAGLTWDNIIADIYDEIYVTTYNIDNSLIYEMDNVENYEFINQKWKEIKEKGNDII